MTFAAWVAAFPWLIGVALCFALAARRPVRRSDAPALAGLAALTVVTFVGRLVLVPQRFFHQNGQGPGWVERATVGVFAEYGPGLWELFHGAITLRPRDPESAVFFVQSLLAATTPACVWLIAHRVSRDRQVALLLALVVALDPMLARLARSESYYGTGASLVALAMAALAAPAALAPLRSASFVCASLAAGALVAQAARVHPIVWPAAALTPWVLVLGPGALRRRARAALAASVIIASVVALVALPSMLTAMRSELATRFSPTQGWNVAPRLALHLACAGPLAVALIVFARRRAHAALIVGAAAIALAVLDAGDFAAAARLKPWLRGAYLRMYVPALVVVAAAVARAIGYGPRRRLVATACAVLLVVCPIAVRARVDAIVPTDAREQALARVWREQIPPTAVVGWLAMARVATILLPIDRWNAPRGFDARPASVEYLPRALTNAGADRFYYHSSLCSTREGVEACAAFERSHRLTEIGAWTLPAIESYTEPYVTPSVRVALYRLTDQAR